MIKAVIFDCFGVLSNANLWHEFLGDLSDPEQIEKVKELNQHCDAGVITRDDFFNGVKQVTGKVLHDVESLDSTESLKNNRLISYISELKKAGYKIGLISNTGSNWISESFLSQDELVLFDAMILSFEVGVTKPNPEIYEIACERLAIKPDEGVFIDDIEDYCEAARTEGLKAIHYKNYAQIKTDLEQLLNHK